MNALAVVEKLAKPSGRTFVKIFHRLPFPQKPIELKVYEFNLPSNVYRTHSPDPREPHPRTHQLFGAEHAITGYVGSKERMSV